MSDYIVEQGSGKNSSHIVNSQKNYGTQLSIDLR